MRFEGGNKNLINTSLIYKTIDNQVVSEGTVENDSSELIINVLENIRNMYTPPSGCIFFRTEPGCQSESQIPFYVEIPISGDLPYASSPTEAFDPFIYGSPGYYHGPYTTKLNARTLEIHLQTKNYSSLFDSTLLLMGDDHSQLGNYFVTDNNFPFALELPQNWRFPAERVDLLESYPELELFIQSNGQHNTNWFSNPNLSKVIDDE